MCVCLRDGELSRCVRLPRVRTFILQIVVHGQVLFTTDHALFTLPWYMDPWVLFQLSEQPRER